MKYKVEEEAARGQTIRTETGRDRSDDTPNEETLVGREMKGGDGDLSATIKNGKVPTD